MRRLLLTLLLALAPVLVQAAETCTYRGGGDYDAQIALTTIAERQGTTLRLRALWRLTARPLPFYRFEYLVEEISEWQGQRLIRLGLNLRHFVNGRIRRQQWDVFARTGDGFAAWRLQGKRAEELAGKHAGFARHWDVADFGQPWLADYPTAAAEARSDLALKPGEAPAGLVPPFAAGFYLPRFAPAAPQRIALFIPGNKQQNRADLDVPAPAPAPAGGHVWRITLESEKLGLDRGSQAVATIAPGGRLAAIRFRLLGFGMTAAGEIALQGCEGEA
jgi:hypothetical protein